MHSNCFQLHLFLFSFNLISNGAHKDFSGPYSKIELIKKYVHTVARLVEAEGTGIRFGGKDWGVAEIGLKGW